MTAKLVACGALALASMLGGGCKRALRVPESRPEFFVKDVPQTLDDAKALARWGTSVEVVRGAPKDPQSCTGNGLCVFMLPLEIAQKVVPERDYVVTVKKRGKLSMTAIYSEFGVFHGATLYDGSTARQIVSMHLECSHHHDVVVEWGRASIEADGSQGTLTRSRIEDQIPLAAEYAEMLKGTEIDQGGNRCMHEALRVLGADGVPPVKEAIARSTNRDARSNLLSEICKPSDGLVPDASLRQELVEALFAGPLPADQLETGFTCFEKPLGEERSIALVKALASGLVASKEPDRAVGVFSALEKKTELTNAIEKASESCADKAIKSALAALAHAPVDPDGAADTITHGAPSIAAFMAGHLDPKIDSHRLALVRALAEPSSEASDVLATLVAAHYVPSDAERTVILHRAIDPGPAREGDSDVDAGDSARIAAITLLAKGATQAELAEVRAASPARPSKPDAELEMRTMALRIGLGDSTLDKDALQEVVGTGCDLPYLERQYAQNPHPATPDEQRCDVVLKDHGLLGAALSLGRCYRSAIYEAGKGARGVKYPAGACPGRS